MLRDKIINKKSGILLYGLTPPKITNTIEKNQETSKKRIAQISQMDIDGLILYDIQDEKTRNQDTRPFPYIPALDPDFYDREYLSELKLPKIIYKCVGKYTREELVNWIKSTVNTDAYAVFVGVASPDQQVNITLPEVYQLQNQLNKELLIGGITIPERHVIFNDEPQRIIDKYQKGCSFFVSQCIYDLEIAKKCYGDYYTYFKDHQYELIPIILTISPCGSVKTLEFMKWLGISIPPELETELKQSANILDKSVEICLSVMNEMVDFFTERRIPIGFNVESVSVKKEEINASLYLVKEGRKLFKKKGIC